MSESDTAEVVAEIRPKTGVLHLLLHRKRMLAGAAIILVFLLSAIMAPVFAPSDPSEMDLGKARQPPSTSNLLGTDELGRDLLSRILYGGRVTLIIAIVALAISALLGTALGIAAGVAGGSWDNLLMRLIDIQLAFPGVILAIAIVAVIGPGIPGLIVALALFPIPAFARLSRATTMVIMTQDYILAARAIGVGRLRVVVRHVLPNNLGPLLVQASLMLPGIILIGSSMGFLGLGVQPPTPEWGAMLSRGRDYVVTAPHLGIFPGIAVTLVVLGFTLLGDSLRDMLDPHLRKLEA